jgi:hypothetical protein
MSKLAPEAFAILCRIKTHGLDAWLPGKHAFARLGDTNYTRVNAQIVRDLLREGYLVSDTESNVSVSLAGDDALAKAESMPVQCSKFRVGGLWFQIDTEDWGVAQDAAQARGIVVSGLQFLAKTNTAKLAAVHAQAMNGVHNEALTAIVVSALGIVTAKYGDEFAAYQHHIGIRAYREKVPQDA